MGCRQPRDRNNGRGATRILDATKRSRLAAMQEVSIPQNHLTFMPSAR